MNTIILMCINNEGGKTEVQADSGTHVVVPVNQFVYSVLVDGFPVACRDYRSNNTTATGFTGPECYSMLFGIGNIPYSLGNLPVSAVERNIQIAGLPFRYLSSDTEQNFTFS